MEPTSRSHPIGLQSIRIFVSGAQSWLFPVCVWFAWKSRETVPKNNICQVFQSWARSAKTHNKSTQHIDTHNKFTQQIGTTKLTQHIDATHWHTTHTHNKFTHNKLTQPCSRNFVQPYVPAGKRENNVPIRVGLYHYGVATISRLLKITGLFCKRAL